MGPVTGPRAPAQQPRKVVGDGLVTIPGVSVPAPYVGKQRQIIIDVDPARLSSKGFSQMDVVGALQTTNVIVPAVVARIGEREFNVKLNSSPQMVEQFRAEGLKSGERVAVNLPDEVRDNSRIQPIARR